MRAIITSYEIIYSAIKWIFYSVSYGFESVFFPEDRLMLSFKLNQLTGSMKNAREALFAAKPPHPGF